MLKNLTLKMQLEKKLKESNNDTPEFSLNGKFKLAKIVNIYDGDTCKAVFKFGDELYRWNIRMAGYDTPEMRPSRSDPNRDKEKEAAIKSRDYLKSLIMNPKQLVYIKCGEFDKYGRLLAEIFINKDDKISVNQMMIDGEYGYQYGGGTKKKFQF